MEHSDINEALMRAEAKQLIDLTLTDDIGRGDVTCEAVIPEHAVLSGVFRLREPGVVCGTWIADLVMKAVDPSIDVRILLKDGSEAEAQADVLDVTGPARGVLTAERTALNFMQRLSGVATQTREFVRRVAHTDVRILDTRKTTPGFRHLEKYAVRCGGGYNHRMGLHDRIMVKDNHLAIRSALGEALDWKSLVSDSKRAFPGTPIEIEVDTVEQFRKAVLTEPDWILLDNMTLDDLRACVALNAGGCQLEASGGVSLDTVTSIAETSVDAISVGSITHSAPSLDIGLDYGVAAGSASQPYQR